MSAHREEQAVPIPLLTPEDAAHLLGIGRTKVYELILTRALDSVKIGTSRRIPTQAVISYVAALTTDHAWCGPVRSER